jgi:predicted nuclease with TOPRIM domain
MRPLGGGLCVCVCLAFPDWAYYRKNISDKSLVDAFEADWKALVAPEFADETAAETKASLEGLLAKAAEMKANASGRVAELEKVVAELSENLTDRDTTFAEIYARFPELKKEIDQELKDEDYVKDSGV